MCLFTGIRKINHYLVLLLLCLAVVGCASGRGRTEELVRGPFEVTHEEDFDGDNKPETFSLEWKVVRDYAFDLDTRQRSPVKFTWYQSRLRVIKAADTVLADDLFAFKDTDFADDIRPATGDPKLTPEDYLNHYFASHFPNPAFVSFGRARARIDRSNIDRALIEEFIKHYRSTATLQEIERELLTGSHTIFVYTRSWSQDLGIITYSQGLGHAVFLVNPKK